MGNARYADRPLRNPVNDSALMARTLQALGFEVQVANDVDRRGMLTALRDFENRSRGADVALFYFAGHGAQVGGANYLIPVNAGIRAENDVPDEAIDAASVLRRIEDTRVKVGLVVLDACRDNPFPGASRSGARGLARMSVPTSTIVAYATAPGSTADDGSGENSTYTATLAKYLATPGLDVKEIFDRTAQEVERATNGKQRPREDIGLRGRFALLDVGAGGASMASVPTRPDMTPAAPDPDTEAWEVAKRRDSATSYRAYLQSFPQGRYEAAARASLLGLGTVTAGLSTTPTTSGSSVNSAAANLSPEVGRVQEIVLSPDPFRSSAPAPSPPARADQTLHKPGDVFKDCDLCPEMVVIPAGRFLMGSPLTEARRSPDEGPQRTVNVPAFAIGKYEVTQGQWLAVMDSNPSSFSSCGVNCPVENVSWNDVQEFLRRLGERTGKMYRMPTEAEWEYAARAGTGTAYFWGEDFDQSRANIGWKTVKVGSYAPNAFGLHDMHGNVGEWVQDVWHDNFGGAPADGSSWTFGGNQSWRVVRGGWIGARTWQLRSAARIGWWANNFSPVINVRPVTPGDDQPRSIGFRIVRLP